MNARNDCEERGGTLAIPEISEENTQFGIGISSAFPEGTSIEH